MKESTLYASENYVAYKCPQCKNIATEQFTGFIPSPFKQVKTAVSQGAKLGLLWNCQKCGADIQGPIVVPVELDSFYLRVFKPLIREQRLKDRCMSPMIQKGYKKILEPLRRDPNLKLIESSRHVDSHTVDYLVRLFNSSNGSTIQIQVEYKKTTPEA